MNAKEAASQILPLIGGKENIASATHCMTRLRITPNDPSLIQSDEIKKIPGIVGTNVAGSQFQIIIGTKVSDVYKEFSALAELDKTPTKEETSSTVNNTNKKFSLKGCVNTVMDVISSCVTPLIPIITAAGLIKLIATIIGPSMFGLVSDTSNILTLLTFVGDAGFYFFPFYVGYGAAKKFNCSVPLTLFIAGIMLHPTLLSIVSEGTAFTVFGIPMTPVNYSSNFISIILVTWILSYVEKFLTKYIPSTLRSLLVPLLTVLIMLPLALCVLGPIGYWVGQGIAAVITFIHSLVGPLAIAIVCALWPFLVCTGMHQALIAIAMSNIATFGFDNTITVGGFLSSYPVIAVALVFALKSKKAEEKAQAFTNLATLAIGGVSEPTLFGIILTHKKAILYTLIGGFVGGLYAGFTGVATYFFGSASVLAALSFAGDNPASLRNGIIAAVICFVVSFVIAMIFGFDENKKEQAS